MFFDVKFVFLLALCSVAASQSSETTSGGVEKVSNEDPHMLSALNSVEGQIRSRYNAAQGTTIQLGKIHSATLQIVAGNRWEIELDLHTKLCSPDCVHNTQKCSISIFSQPWINEHQLLTLKCQ